MSVLDVTEDLVGQKIHGVSDGTPGGTLLALIAGLEGFAAGLGDVREKGVWVHCFSLNAIFSSKVTEASSRKG